MASQMSHHKTMTCLLATFFFLSVLYFSVGAVDAPVVLTGYHICYLHVMGVVIGVVIILMCPLRERATMNTKL